MGTFQKIFGFLYTYEDERLFDFLYVYDDPVKQSNIRYTKRFTNPKFKFMFENKDTGETVDWSRGGAWIKSQTRKYNSKTQLSAILYTYQNKLVGNLKVEIVKDMGSKGLKIKFIDPDYNVQQFFDKTIKEQTKG